MIGTTLTSPPNFEVLWRAVSDAFPGRLVDFAVEGLRVTASVKNQRVEDQVMFQAVCATHDPQILTDGQQADQRRRQAESDLFGEDFEALKSLLETVRDEPTRAVLEQLAGNQHRLAAALGVTRQELLAAAKER